MAHHRQHIIHDWLEQCTPENAVVMSWWEYGYQIAGMVDRPTLIDSSTWNNTYIAISTAISSSEEGAAYPTLCKHDVDCVFIIFSGLSVILEMTSANFCGWFKGEYEVDDRAMAAMRNGLMYRMSYYRYAGFLLLLWGRN
ncbi:hypothetical protein K435DRAFT_864532 [Dendrothele bispora CBS 962.96]|uniref:STT3/PglB/AglB core domain-containing protein n=1 Tax=Dendrothele bispora (strain CBS 962.96) TaxID=1314807 RepID=A0A4S8LLN2_DENBC|nr:hypothetical protein K435DRAFT_864532 [Dendrothele bispora CBS 962.96]